MSEKDTFTTANILRECVLSKEYSARGGLIQLTEDDLEKLESVHKDQTPEKLKELISAGVGMLALDVATDGASSGPIDLDVEEQKLAIEPSLGALNIGDFARPSLGLYFQKGKMEQLFTDGGENSLPILKCRFNGSEQADTFAMISSESPTIKLGFELECYPKVSDIFTYSFYDKEGEIVGIIPIKIKEADQKLKLDETVFKNVYVRPSGEKPPLGYYQYLAERASVDIKRTMGNLGIVGDDVIDVDLMINHNKISGGSRHQLTDADGRSRDIIILNRLKSKEANSTRNRIRILRHEWLHALDSHLGDGQGSYSDSVGERVVKFINKEFPLKKAKWKDSGTVEENTPLAWIFSEHNVIKEIPCGHADDGIPELAASCLNIGCDTHFNNEKSWYPEGDEFDIYKIINEYLEHELTPHEINDKRRDVIEFVKGIYEDRLQTS